MSRQDNLMMTLDDMVSCGQNLSAAARELYSCGELMIRLANQMKETDPAGEGKEETLSEDRSSSEDTDINKEETAAVRAAQERNTRAADTPPAAGAPEAVPADSARTYKLEDVRAVLARRSSEGYREEVKGLLKKYGASKLSEISPEHYAALAAEAEAIGHAG